MIMGASVACSALSVWIINLQDFNNKLARPSTIATTWGPHKLMASMPGASVLRVTRNAQNASVFGDWRTGNKMTELALKNT
jgi:hypothetical protein